MRLHIYIAKVFNKVIALKRIGVKRNTKKGSSVYNYFRPKKYDSLYKETGDFKSVFQV